MPRDGSSIYSQPFPDVSPDTTIESPVYNGFVADIATDLNAPRPILAGGTGAASANEALTNLSAEKSLQVVTNYDSMMWMPGSFYSASSATSAPVTGHAFVGYVYLVDSNNIVIEARDQNDTAIPGRKYVREKKAGIWSAWKSDTLTLLGTSEGVSGEIADMSFGLTGTAPNSAFVVNTESDGSGINAMEVSKAGNTTIRDTSGHAQIILNKSSGATGKVNDIIGQTNGLSRWLIRLGHEGTETGGNAGSDFFLYAASDAGAFTPALGIQRSNQLVTFYQNMTVLGTLSAGNLSVPGNAAVAGNTTLSTTQINGSLTANTSAAGWQMRLVDSMSGWSKYFRTNSGGSLEFINHAFTGVLMTLTDAGILDVANQVISRSPDAFRMRGSVYSLIHRIDGSNYWQLITNAGDQDGTFNALRPFNIELATGNVTMSHAVTIGGTLTTNAINANGTITGAGSINAARLQTTANYGVESLDYTTQPGPVYLVQAYSVNPNYGPIRLQGVHFPSAWAGWRFDVNSQFFDFRNDGSAVKTSGSTVWIVTSDARIKDVTGRYNAGLDEVTALRPVKFKYKEGELRDREHIGLVAQEVEGPMPELVSQSKGKVDGVDVDDLRNLDVGPLIFALVNAVKELKTRVEELEAVK